MNNAPWERVELIFHNALDLSLEDRNSYLLEECAGDTGLFSEVESLLINFEKNSDFLDEPVFGLGLNAINREPQKNLSGSVIGFYEVREKIGAGGMGEVYKAVDTRLNRPVALKFLSQSLENDNAAKRRLVKEAQAVAMLDHPNICSVYGIEESKDHHFIVMQYVKGMTLSEWIDDHQTFSVDEFKKIARQILSAVAFAHSHGIIHRDLKPGNIMITGDGQIKVLDFGLAQVIEQKQLLGNDSIKDASLFSQNGLIIGTVSYMSPEQLRSEKLDYRTDIFSIGIIFCELLTKKNPFNRKSQAETIAAILNNDPLPVNQSVPQIPKEIAGLIEKCLSKSKETRFQSASEILIEIDKIEPEKISYDFFRKPRPLLTKTAFIIIILLAVFAVAFVYSDKPEQKTLAVLPISFKELPPEKEYLAGGLTQSIIEKLSNISDLKVKNEFITEAYGKEIIEPQSAGKILKVDVVFTGSITERNNRLFLTTKLIRTDDGSFIDSNEEEVDENNLIDLQEKISSQIASKIKTNLTSEDKNKIHKKDTESEEAKNFYFQGRYYLKRKTSPEDIEKAVQYFFNAKEIDQNFAKAWTGLADAYLLQAAPGVKGAVSPAQAVRMAKLAAKKALELDNNLAESYNSFGLISLRYEWNWSEAENYFKTAISRNPEFLPARFGLINALKIQERYDEAMEEAKKTKEIDPLSINSDIQMALIYYRKHDYKQTDDILSDLLQRVPDDIRVKYVRVYQLLKTGRVKEAIEILEPIYNLKKDGNKILAAAPLGFSYARMGQRQKALNIIRDLDNFGKNTYVPAQEKALIYVGLGDYNKAFENLNLSCTERFSSLPNWINDPIVDEIKTDPRFAEIRKCVNL